MESYLDEEQWLGEKYTLEVSSPGVSRPLSVARQYPKHIGRKLAVNTHEGEKIEGKLISVEEDGIVLFFKTREKQGKKKVTIEKEVKILFDQIKKAVVKISFN